MKGLIAFLILVVAPLAFWVESKGLALRQAGYGWVPFIEGIVTAAIFALVVSGLPGKKVAGTDDQGMPFFSRFWSVFGLLAIAKIVFAAILYFEA